MRTVEEIRLDNLNALVREFGSIAKLAKKAGTPPNYISQIRKRVPSKTGNPRDVGSDLARKLEEGCSKERGWMDHDHSMENLISAENVVNLTAKQNLPPYETLLFELVTVAKNMSDRGVIELIGRAKELALQHPKAKANLAS